MANELRSPCANYLEQSELRDRIREVIEVERRAWNKTAAAGATVHFLADELIRVIDENDALKNAMKPLIAHVRSALDLIDDLDESDVDEAQEVIRAGELALGVVEP